MTNQTYGDRQAEEARLRYEELEYDLQQLKLAKGDVVLLNIKTNIPDKQLRHFRRALHEQTKDTGAHFLVTCCSEGLDMSVYSPRDLTSLEDRIRRLEEIGAHVWEADCRKDHPQWGDWHRGSTMVKLDGVKQSHCLAADSTRGAVLRFKVLEHDGKRTKFVTGNGDVKTEIVFGKVEIYEKDMGLK